MSVGRKWGNLEGGGGGGGAGGAPMIYGRGKLQPRFLLFTLEGGRRAYYLLNIIVSCKKKPCFLKPLSLLLSSNKYTELLTI